MEAINDYFEIFDFYGLPLLLIAFVTLFILECFFPFRREENRSWKRIMLNLGIVFTVVPTFRLLLIPALTAIAQWTEAARFGVFNIINLPVWLKCLITFLLLDYFNYAWHQLKHELNFLWRFHQVHHFDNQMDITTSGRFHIGELVFAVFYHGGLILITGVNPVVVLIYQLIFEMATQFHHSNIYIPLRLEKFLRKLIITPSLHAIHHQLIDNEEGSNFGIVFSFWDKLHKTLKTGDENLIIQTDPLLVNEVKVQSFFTLLAMPFTKLKRKKRIVATPVKFEI